ncbi:MAG: hypothetical protein Fur0037_20750 [Planctomycetota bacterium]
MHSRPLTLLAAILLGSMSAVLPAQGVRNSPHDFVGQPWQTTGELCLPCHIPHTQDHAGPIVKPLWSHGMSAANYVLYSSPSLRAQPEQPLGPSRLCLSCHDGTVALDMFAGRTGTTMLTGEANLTTDLSATHPISIRWTHKGVGACSNCHYTHGRLFDSPVPFYDGRVECPTCHDPHNQMERNPGGTYFLRVPILQSELCFVCHGK